MRNRFRLKGAAVALAVLGISGVTAISAAVADNVVNYVNLHSTVGVGGNIPVELDPTTHVGSFSVDYEINKTGGDCDATPATPARVAINTPSGITANPAVLSFTACDVRQTATFTVTAAGDYDIPEATSSGNNTNPTAFKIKAADAVVAPPPGGSTDTTPPVVAYTVSPAPNAAGWNKSDVMISWTITDAQSPLTATPGCGTQDATDSTKYTETLSDETAGTSRICSATSAGGTTEVTTSPLIMIDKTAPSLGISDNNTASMDICNGAPARPAFSPSDVLSGLDGTEADNWTTPTAASGVGAYVYSAHAADIAGNGASESRTYNAIYGAAFGGVLQPINSDGSSRFKLGSTIPVKFKLTCGTTPITDAVAKLTVAKDDSTANSGLDEAVSTSAATTGNAFRYDTAGQQYIFNLSTKLGYTNPGATGATAFSNGTWTLGIHLDDGTTKKVKIQLVK